MGNTITHTVHVEGRRWFQRSYGNTYHTVRVWINGREVGTSDHTYGYGDHYMHTAAALVFTYDRALFAELTGDTTSETNERAGYTPLARASRERGHTVSVSVIDVRLQRDLHRLEATA